MVMVAEIIAGGLVEFELIQDNYKILNVVFEDGVLEVFHEDGGRVGQVACWRSWGWE